MTSHFQPPIINDNPTGWGPSDVPEQFKDMPYQPFSKGDRLGKVADWTGSTYQDRRYMNRYHSQYGGGTQYAYYHEEDEHSFTLVDTTKLQRPMYQRGRGRFQRGGFRGMGGRGREKANVNMMVLSKSQKSRERVRQQQVRKWQKQFGGRQRFDNRNQQQIRNRDASVQVRQEWTVVEDMDFTRMSKLSLPAVDDPKDIMICGELEYYSKVFDRVTTKNEKKLKRVNRIFHKVTTTDDPIIRKLAKTDEGNVFATDAILACLMCSTRSSYSWDIIVQRVGNKLFFDKREDSDFDLLTVSETANEPPVDEGTSINSPRNLALEATFINHNFSQQVLMKREGAGGAAATPASGPSRLGQQQQQSRGGGGSGKGGGAAELKYKFDRPNPFIQDEEEEEDEDNKREEEVASVAYRYRKWDLGDKITLITRCEHDAVMLGPNGEVQFINIKALNEWDSRLCGGVDWRSKLDSQRGAVLATELKNNSCKLAKWTVCALLAGSDQLKFGYVSRLNVRDSARHVILGTQQFKPAEFANQINLSMENAWGILRCIIDTCMKLEEGKYLILKDPNKPVIRIYDIPDNTFESDDSDVDSDELQEEDLDDLEEEDESDSTDEGEEEGGKEQGQQKEGSGVSPVPQQQQTAAPSGPTPLQRQTSPSQQGAVAEPADTTGGDKGGSPVPE